jgi:NAD(P)-dependent dehydrogenase (short-subunit alcohol dehydrogenase family)
VELNGSVAIVTGAGTGLGRQLATTLAREGMRVVCCGRRAEPLDETVGLVEARKGRALALPLDITQHDQVVAMVGAVLEKFGRIDVLVNNAGSFASSGGLWECDVQQWWHDVEVNLRGTMLCCHAVLPHMVERGGGSIVNLSGGGAESPLIAGSGYGCSKAAILRLTDTLALELQEAKTDVRVYAVDPGFNRTAMTEDLARGPYAVKWRPGIVSRLDKDDGSNRETFARTVVDLLKADLPELSGRVFHGWKGVRGAVEQAAKIRDEDLLTLRLRKLDA